MIDLVDRYLLPAAYSLLPTRMSSPEATAMVLAVGLQESRFAARIQQVDGVPLDWWRGGPARGFWQFERGGAVAQVLLHPTSRPHLLKALKTLGYPGEIDAPLLHSLLAHNDVLAAVCARLLLWTDQHPMPRESEGPEAGWQCYIRNWRPGKPHRATWDAFWAEAWRRTRQQAAA